MQAETKLSSFKALIARIYAGLINGRRAPYFCVFAPCIPFATSLDLSEHCLRAVLFQTTSIPSHFVCQVLHSVS